MKRWTRVDRALLCCPLSRVAVDDRESLHLPPDSHDDSRVYEMVDNSVDELPRPFGSAARPVDTVVLNEHESSIHA